MPHRMPQAVSRRRVGLAVLNLTVCFLGRVQAVKGNAYPMTAMIKAFKINMTIGNQTGANTMSRIISIIYV